MRGRSHPRPKNLNCPIPRLCSGSGIVVRPLLIAYPWHCLSPPLNVRGSYAPVPSRRAERTEYSTPRPDGGGSRGDARSVGYYRQNSGCQGEIGLRASGRGRAYFPARRSRSLLSTALLKVSACSCLTSLSFSSRALRHERARSL